MNVAIVPHAYFMNMTIILHESCRCMHCVQQYASPMHRYANPVQPYAPQPNGMCSHVVDVQALCSHMPALCRHMPALCSHVQDLCAVRRPCASAGPVQPNMML